MKSLSIEELRQALRTAEGDAERLFAFVELAAHPELEWGDLLAALVYREPTCTQAAYQLHSLLGIPTDHGRALIDPGAWSDLLARRGIDSARPIRFGRTP